MQIKHFTERLALCVSTHAIDGAGGILLTGSQSICVLACCSLDPIPTWLVKEMRGLLSPFISLLFHKSLFTGLFPTEFKEAIVRPLLKKSGLDFTQKKNYRPVSNLSFLSKLLERIAQARLEVFLDSSDLMPTMQSAYRRFHSTETAVMKVYNDLHDGGLSTMEPTIC